MNKLNDVLRRLVLTPNLDARLREDALDCLMDLSEKSITVTAFGQSYRLAESLVSKLNMVGKIEAIKKLREVHSLSLKEAKDVMDKMEQDKLWIAPVIS